MQSASTQLSMAAYKMGSYILVEDKVDNPNFYIIRSGQVRVQTKSELITSELVKETSDNVLNPGDFFGVISAMSGHPSIESVIALSDVVLIVVKRDQFGMLIQKNGPIAMKIIRSFSRQLRYFDTAITMLSFASSIEEDPMHLLSLGEYYFKQKNWPTASYAYNKYLEYNPESQHVMQARQRLAQLAPFLKGQLNQQAGDSTPGFARIYDDGSVIFLEHEIGHELYIIQDGAVKIKKVVANNEITLAILQKGDIFGEMAILDDKPRSATAVAYGRAVLLAVNKSNFQGMVQQQPQLATKIITLLSERIWTAYRQFANAVIEDPIGKIFDMLYTQLVKNHIVIQKGLPHTFDFGANELLGMIGLSAEKDKGLVKDLFASNKKIMLLNEKIHVTDLEEVQKQANYYKNQWLRKRKLEEARGN